MPTSSRTFKIAALGSSFASGAWLEPVVHKGSMRSSSNYAHQLVDLLSSTSSPSGLENPNSGPIQSQSGSITSHPGHAKDPDIHIDLTDVTSAGSTLLHILNEPQPLLNLSISPSRLWSLFTTSPGPAAPPQITAIPPDADLVLLTAGGNDLGYSAGMLRDALLASLLPRFLSTALSPTLPAAIAAAPAGSTSQPHGAGAGAGTPSEPASEPTPHPASVTRASPGTGTVTQPAADRPATPASDAGPGTEHDDNGETGLGLLSERDLARRYAAVLDAVHAAAPAARVLLVEYLPVFSACLPLPSQSPSHSPSQEQGEHPLARAQVQRYVAMAALMRRAGMCAVDARRGFAEFVHVGDDVGDQHALGGGGDEERWMSGFSLTMLWRGQVMPFHPTVQGHAGVARVLAKRVAEML